MRTQRSEGPECDIPCRTPSGGTLIKIGNRANANFPRGRNRPFLRVERGAAGEFLPDSVAPRPQFTSRHLMATVRVDIIEFITKSQPKVSHQTATVTFRDAAAGLPAGTGLVQTLTSRPNGPRLTRCGYADRRWINQPTNDFPATGAGNRSGYWQKTPTG